MLTSTFRSPAPRIRPATIMAQELDTHTPFSTVAELFQITDHTEQDFLIFAGVYQQDLNLINRQRTQHRSFRLRRYHADTHILVIVIPRDLHEELHLGIWMRFFAHLVRRGSEQNWRAMGSATRRAAGHPGGDGGEGDSTGGPIPEREHEYAWPTFVIEAGRSESLSELHNDMKWWFSASDHQVKIVLLSKYDDNQDVILLERWEEQANTSTRSGATTTRRSAAQYAATLQPVLRQSITITRDQGTNPESYQVISGALVLSFKLLFLRDPLPGEGDIIVSTQELEDWARRVWLYV